MLWLGILGVVVLAVGLLVLQAMAGDDGGDAATDSTAPETTVPETTEAPTATDATTTTTDAPTTTEAPTTTAAPTTTTSGDSGGQGADSPAGLAVTYFEALDREDLDEAWAMTTPRFQARQDRDQWERFWTGHDVEVVDDPRVDEDAGVVVVPITYDGQREDYRLDVVRQGGRWLVDGPVGR